MRIHMKHHVMDSSASDQHFPWYFDKIGAFRLLTGSVQCSVSAGEGRIYRRKLLEVHSLHIPFHLLMWWWIYQEVVVVMDMWARSVKNVHFYCIGRRFVRVQLADISTLIMYDFNMLIIPHLYTTDEVIRGKDETLNIEQDRGVWSGCWQERGQGVDWIKKCHSGGYPETKSSYPSGFTVSLIVSIVILLLLWLLSNTLYCTM